MKIIDKLLKGDKRRRSRFHDEKGNFAGWKHIFLHIVPAFFTGILRVTVGYRPALPWISYSAMNEIKKHLTKNSRVLEFGSGMSTIWYADYAGEIYSVEDYLPWYNKTQSFIKKKGIVNINYKFADNEIEYYSFMSDDKQGFDYIVVDGSCRSKCIANAVKILKPGGILYLDNSDKDSSGNAGDMRVAEELLRSFAKNSGAKVTEYVDFAPTQFFVQQGILLKMPG
jgi:protein-L-isoaspartate O-methyltransferase